MTGAMNVDDHDLGNLACSCLPVLAWEPCRGCGAPHRVLIHAASVEKWTYKARVRRDEQGHP